MTAVRTLTALAATLIGVAVVAGCAPVPPDPSVVVPTAVPLPPAAEHPETAPIAGTSGTDPTPSVEPETGIHISRPHIYACVGPRRHLGVRVGVCL